VSATYTLSSDLTTLSVTPDAPIDSAEGVWSLVFSTNVRDIAGNQLDGAWTDTAAGYTATFGAVADALPVVSSCAPDRDTFTPDGDDGDDADADVVALTPAATAAPAWWWLVVTDANGERVRSLREPGTDVSVAWDGRADDGLVVGSGRYTLNLHAIDGLGNVGAACTTPITLAQPVETP
jgi:hypothetical protein